MTIFKPNKSRAFPPYFIKSFRGVNPTSQIAGSLYNYKEIYSPSLTRLYTIAILNSNTASITNFDFLINLKYV